MYRLFLLTFVLAAGSLNSAMAGKYNEVLDIGDTAPAWSDLEGVDGKRHALADIASDKLVVVVFTCNSCPVAVDYEDRIIAFAKAHAAEIAVVAINVNPGTEERLEPMKQRATEKNFPYPYLYDDSQQIARDYGAVFTPQFFVLDSERKIAYMGGMDDSSNAKAVTQRYLEDAINAVLAGRRPAVDEAPAPGCRIRYARERRR